MLIKRVYLLEIKESFDELKMTLRANSRDLYIQEN